LPVIVGAYGNVSTDEKKWNLPRRTEWTKGLSVCPIAARIVIDLIGSDRLTTKPECLMCVWSRGCFLRALPAHCIKDVYDVLEAMSLCLSSGSRKVSLLCRKLYTNLVHVTEHYLISFMLFSYCVLI
jgi:hypothetical protein